jgi:hypothetical protein
MWYNPIVLVVIELCKILILIFVVIFNLCSQEIACSCGAEALRRQFASCSQNNNNEILLVTLLSLRNVMRRASLCTSRMSE